jgi:SpoVK/Ycf46/Vps4 family AAA+-type ATPase
MGEYKKKLLYDCTFLLVGTAITFLSMKYAAKFLNPNLKKKEEAKLKSENILKRMGISKLDLTEYEEIIASEIISPEDLTVGFKDLGGVSEVIEALKETVIYPLIYPQLFQSVSGLLNAPRGVLLYGPPGCGKTMLAKALAKESGATFINLHVSTMTDKWFGESQKLTNALFSLAKKLQPAIIFIDEIDSFLRTRQYNDHEATAMMKAEFMALWDGIFCLKIGLQSGENSQIVILGATNRPNDLDSAILRRMPKRFHIDLPNVNQRLSVLNLVAFFNI